MHNKKLLLAACVIMSIGLLYGCSANGGKDVTKTPATASAQMVAPATKPETNDSTKENVKAIKTSVVKTTAREAIIESIKDVPMVKLPKGIEGVKAETKSNAKLEALIKKEYKIPDEFLSKTSYYYNYVNLNDKSNKQIFVVISGPYTSGSGGDSALLVGESDGKMYVSQRFTLVNVPVIISDNKTNGLHDIIMPFNGGGAKSQYKVLKAGETSYSNINDSKSIKSLDGIKGKAIITNDILKEIENGQSGIRLK